MQDCYLFLLCILIFFNRTSADEKFPVVVTELTFPSVAVESVPFAIQTGETVNCYSTEAEARFLFKKCDLQSWRNVLGTVCK